jgi:hypothetical protein
MTSGWQIRAGIVGVVTLALVALATLSATAPTAWAEVRPVPPTPTNEGAGGGGSGGRSNRDRATTPLPPRASVGGYVYDYSLQARQGGVRVVLDGGEWQMETVTDSNGYYRFADITPGPVVLNLILPAEATQVTADWPLTVRGGEVYTANLGYYWGKTPVLPVALSGRLSGNMLILEVVNNTPEEATGGVLEVRMPKDLQLATDIRASQGAAAFQPGHLQVRLEALPGDERADVRVALTPKTSAAGAPADIYASFPAMQRLSEQIRVTFTYDQQITPQHLILGPAAAAAVTAAPTAAVAAGPSPRPRARATAPSSGDEMMSAQDVPASAEAPAASGSGGDEVTSAAPSPPAGGGLVETLIPVTGGAAPDAALRILPPAVLVAGLAVAGWRRMRARR